MKMKTTKYERKKTLAGMRCYLGIAGKKGSEFEGIGIKISKAKL